MANYFFIGDGSEVLACESVRENATERLKELVANGADADMLNIYECDATELTRDDSTEEGKLVWANPAEYAQAAEEYDMPTLAEVIARDNA